MVSMGRDLRLRSTPSRTVPSRDENPVTATPFIPTLTNRDARNPFRFRSYANTGVSPAFSSRRSRSFVALHFPKSFKCNTYGPPACVANKRLTPKVNPLDATLTKNRGRGVHPLAPCLLFGATIRKLGHPTSPFAGGYECIAASCPCLPLSWRCPLPLSHRSI